MKYVTVVVVSKKNTRPTNACWIPSFVLNGDSSLVLWAVCLLTHARSPVHTVYLWHILLFTKVQNRFSLNRPHNCWITMLWNFLFTLNFLTQNYPKLHINNFKLITFYIFCFLPFFSSSHLQLSQRFTCQQDLLRWWMVTVTAWWPPARPRGPVHPLRCSGNRNC